LARGRLLAAALLAALASWGCGGGGGEAHLARFAAGNEAYERGAYDEAATIYRELIASGAGTAAVRYNLGNALFKSGRLGAAILEYERALEIDPGDPDVRDNLDYLRSLTVDRITPATTPLAALGISYLLDWTTPDQDAVVFIAAWLLAGLSVTAAVAAGRRSVRRAALWAASFLAIAVLLFGASLATKSYLAATRTYGIVLDGEVNVVSGAGEGNPALFTVHEGLKVRIRSRSEGWVQVSLENGLTGWVPAAALEEV